MSYLFSNRYLAPVDLETDDHAIYISAEIPGLKKEEVEVTYDHGVIGIRGEKKEPSPVTSGNTVREIAYGQFSRQIRVGEIDFDHAKAVYENGVLSLTLPKTASQQNRKLVIG